MTTCNVMVDTLSAQGKGNLGVRLVPVDGQPLPAFDAGAHVDVHLPNGVVRQYSIASAPSVRDHYLLCIHKETTSRGGSSYMHERLRVGDTLTISAPRNLFPLREADYYFLVAGGIGITPLLSMAESLDAQGMPFELHYYVRERINVAFARRLAHGFLHGKVLLHASDEGQPLRGSTPLWLKERMAGSHLYMCGPEGFMDHVAHCAMQLGWESGQLHREAFTPVTPKASVQGTQDAVFEVQLASSGQLYAIPPDKSIAAVLMAQGVDVPLSCEMGICGACLTNVLDGQPDHRDSVQSDADKSAAQQQIALCCSRSCSPRLVIAL